MKYIAIFFCLFVVVFFTPSHNIYGQELGNVYDHEDGSKYFIIELDTQVFPTWGVYRSINYHQIPYFEMTFLADKITDEDGSELLKIVPTYYAYSYRAKIVGQPDTINLKKQKLQFYFRMKDDGKELQYLLPDDETREYLISLSSFEGKEVIDITSMPIDFKLTKKPKWNKFPQPLRNALGARYRGGFKGPVLK